MTTSPTGFPILGAIVIIAEDNDAEGRRASRRAWQTYRAHGLIFTRVRPSEPFKEWAEMNAALASKEEVD